MTFINAKLAEVAQRDPRYAYEAYEFIFQALQFTQKSLGREPPSEPSAHDASTESPHHVTGPELVEGACALAQREFGLMARTVFELWGIQRTDDFGAIVFNLINAELMSRTEKDRPEDFNNLFDLQEALVRGYQIVVE